MKTLLILGGSGFFGKSFLDSYINGDLKKFKVKKIILVSRNLKELKKKYYHLKNVVFKEIDLTKHINLPKADMIVHAAESTIKNYKFKQFKKIVKKSEKISTNIYNYLKQNKEPKSFIYISSGAVYGQRNNKKRFKESEKILIKNINNLEKRKKYYALNKIKSEKKFLKLLGLRHNIKIARCFTFIGKHIPKNESYAVGNFFEQAKNKLDIELNSFNSKYIFRSYLDSKNLVNSLMKMLAFKSKIYYPVFNIGSEQEISIYKLAIMFKKIFNIKVKIPNKNLKKIDYYVPETKKYKKYFKNKMLINLPNYIKKSFNF